MSKKKKNMEINFVAEDIRDFEARTAAAGDDTRFEGEQFRSPQLEVGAATQVSKQIGTGGPVPIIAPRYNTIQLQPIIVPLALVPYMSQDTSMLRTDGRMSQQQYQNDTYVEAVEFEKAPTKTTKKKKRGLKTRVFVLVIFLLSCITLLPFILSYEGFNINTNGMIASLDIITYVKDMIEGGGVIVTQILLVIGAGFMAISVLLSLISLMVGKLPKPVLCISTLISGAMMLSVLIYAVVKKIFVVNDQIIFTICVAVSLLTFVLCAVFSFILAYGKGKREDAKSAVI